MGINRSASFGVGSLLLIILFIPQLAFAASARDLITKPTSKWTAGDSKDFKNHFAYCNDQSWVAPSNLSYQFPPSECQTGGTCTLYSVSGLLSAALGRADYKNFGNRSLKKTSNAPPKLIVAEKGNLDARYVGSQRILGAQSHRLQEVALEMSRLGATKSCDQIGSMKLGGSLTGADSALSLIPALLCGDVKCLPRKKPQEGEALIDGLDKLLIEMCKSKKENGDVILKKDLEELVESYKSSLEEELLQSQNGQVKFDRAQKLAESFYWHRIENGKLFDKEIKFGSSCSAQGADAISKGLLKNMRTYLCAGIPVQTNINMGTLQNVFEESEDGGKTYKSISGYGRDDTHALVATGTYTDGKTGKAYIEFRNSWKEGTPSEPDASLIRIPVEEACHLYSISAIVTPDDKARLKKVDADLTSWGRWADFREIKPGQSMKDTSLKMKERQTKESH